MNKFVNKNNAFTPSNNFAKSRISAKPPHQCIGVGAKRNLTGFTLLNPAKRVRSNLTGFTIIEILLVMFLIMIFTGMTLVNYKSGGKLFALQRSASKMSQDIRIAGQKALSSTKCVETGNNTEDSYGAYFEKKSATIDGKKYIIYVDANDSGEYENEIVDKTVGDDIFLEKNVYISEIKIDGFSVDYVSINFQAPEPTVNIIGGNPVVSGDKVEITIAQEGETKTFIVKANTAGLIEP